MHFADAGLRPIKLMSREKMFVIAALYKFVDLPEYEKIRDVLYDACEREGIIGTILLAHEGINGTIAGSRKGIDNILNWLRSNKEFSDLEHKESFSDDQPFRKLRIRLRPEIITTGKPEISPTKIVGTYVDPHDWNDLINDPEVVLVDTRNDYEVKVGTFKGAKDPDTESFGQFPEWVEKNLDPKEHKKVAMFCTGGIRCEKASSYMLDQGFENVYHLKGGILKYLEEVPEEKTTWEGECFVFDRRVTVKHGLEEGKIEMCFRCGWPVTPEEMESDKYKIERYCPHCYEKYGPQDEG